jgi:carboxyl-terminal processing protease
MKKIGFLIVLSLYINMCGYAQSGDHNFEVAKNLDVFNSLYRSLDMVYVDTIDANKVIGNGIKAMLYSLDPYTIYYPDNEVKELRQMITGKYAGIGALIRENTQHGCCMIDQPYPGMPAHEVGLKKGDRILAIDDSTMIGKKTDYVSSHLRGDAGSTFKLRILRPSTNKEMTFNITRRAIQLPAVTYYGMIQDEIGYINLNQFTENCSKDVRRAFIELKQKGMKKLLFDLRENGGGSVQEAISIINMFVPRDVTILTMKGKMQRANSVYKTTVEPIDTIMPIVVLVSDNTASASEIMAGALQDLDRAVIMGTRTFGKGLVQTTLDLPYNGQLKLTTSKYYIPSGRCIQAIDYKNKNGGYTEHIPDSLTKVFHTIGGREVRDGGGIKPDVELKADTLTNLVYYLINARDSSEVVFNYEYDYIQAHPEIAVPSSFELTDDDFNELKERVLASNFKYDKQTEKYLQQLKELAKFEGYYDDAKPEFDALEAKLVHNTERDLEINREMIKNLVGRAIVQNYYYDSGAMQYSLRFDSQTKKALQLLSSDSDYNAILKK